MEYIITDRKPEKLFHFFEDISAIPRGSKNEKAISDYLVTFAKKRNLWVYQDTMHNIIIKKAGCNGGENASPVMLQGHLDMVCEKRADTDHDFTSEGLRLLEKDGILTADGTTLGADNAVAIALMLTLLDDNALSHPPLECVFTTEEEIGLGGAKALDKSLIKARTMINMDSEEEGVATVSCAGGVRVELIRPIQRKQEKGTLLELDLTGLLGGHSGMDIQKERANANLLMARVLMNLLTKTDGMLVNVCGGSKDNAIPRECLASILYKDERQAQDASCTAQTLLNIIALELEGFEPGFSCKISIHPNETARVVSKEDTQAFLGAILLAPNGVQKRNINQDGFVVTSSNLGVIRTNDSTLHIVLSPRSSCSSLQEEIKERILLLARTFGFTVECSGEYPGWDFQEHSRIRTVFQKAYQKLFNRELRIEAIHAGLECGLFSDAIPGLDAIAVGPSIYNCHTPDESLPLDSFERFYQLMIAVLQNLAVISE